MKKLLMLLTFGRIQSRLGKTKTSFVLRSLFLHLTMLCSTASFAACSSDSSEPLGAEDNAAGANVKTLVVYYSYTNNCETVVNDLRTQISCDVLEIEPKEKGLKYEANNYAIGSEQLNKINANPNDLSSYPEIDPVSLKGSPDGSSVSISQYDCILIAVPLWWSQMATPMQSFLFQYGGQMAGKHIGMIVSSASSGISGVVSRAKELIPRVSSSRKTFGYVPHR